MTQLPPPKHPTHHADEEENARPLDLRLRDEGAKLRPLLFDGQLRHRSPQDGEVRPEPQRHVGGQAEHAANDQVAPAPAAEEWHAVTQEREEDLDVHGDADEPKDEDEHGCAEVTAPRAVVVPGPSSNSSL
ncbi:lipopolysaccharide biosynthesis protein [Babesia caballi]|uniref:Lipopolysaccharide biosynthesis protein n=1 Tax=Babesia caballi TaxID=5871 RepID=A0AAV4LXX0_BABCB|nr:lipopolysaccharide biosynthesis protein [Babesia caballi]